MSIPVNIENIIGERFGILTIVRKSHFTKWEKTFVYCKCDCGEYKNYPIASLKTGNTTSCGCVRKKLVSDKFKIHGLKNHPLYGVWVSMKQRCSNKKRISFKWYGAKGVKVCEEWKGNFKTFFDWCIANGWETGLQLDRKNNDGDYEPSNCRIVTPKVNRNNASNTVKIDFDGQTKTLSEWADYLEIKRSILYDRIFTLKQPVERAFISKHYNYL